MLFIPAIDVVNAEVVRLYQGKIEQKKVYYRSVQEVLELFVRNRVPYIHMVDLDGAISHKPQRSVFDAAAAYLRDKSRFHWAGGIRDQEYLSYLLLHGAEKVVLSTQAFLDKQFVEKALQLFPGRIIISFDFRDTRLCVKGWKEEIPAADVSGLFKEFIRKGCEDFIITDVSSDGTLAGARLDFFATLMHNIQASFYIAGGIGSEDDLRALSKAPLAMLKGVIVGKALYEGKIKIETAQKILNNDIIKT